MQTPGFLNKLFLFYHEGFRSMTVGKTLWIIIFIKLFIMFVVLRIFFFPNFLNSHYTDEASKANHVRQQLIEKSNHE
jgi:uncharacterized membrane protein